MSVSLRRAGVRPGREPPGLGRSRGRPAGTCCAWKPGLGCSAGAPAAAQRARPSSRVRPLRPRLAARTARGGQRRAGTADSSPARPLLALCPGDWGREPTPDGCTLGPRPSFGPRGLTPPGCLFVEATVASHSLQYTSGSEAQRAPSGGCAWGESPVLRHAGTLQPWSTRP